MLGLASPKGAHVKTDCFQTPGWMRSGPPAAGTTYRKQKTNRGRRLLKLLVRQHLLGLVPLRLVLRPQPSMPVIEISGKI